MQLASALGACTAPSRLDEGVDLLGCEVVVIAPLVAHHRRELAGPQAFDLLEAEEAVLAHLVEMVHSDASLDVVADLVGTSQRAGEVRADVEMVLAEGLEVVQRVEGRDP